MHTTETDALIYHGTRTVWVSTHRCTSVTHQRDSTSDETMANAIQMKDEGDTVTYNACDAQQSMLRTPGARLEL